MTDAADNFQGTISGPYIDFAAPGYDIYSTTIAGGYTSGTGMQHLPRHWLRGVVAWIFGLNPTLSPDNVIGILTNTSLQLGSPLYYGWGRIDFGAAASAAARHIAEHHLTAMVQWKRGDKRLIIARESPAHFGAVPSSRPLSGTRLPTPSLPPTPRRSS
jgi:hypothetical protein